MTGSGIARSTGLDTTVIVERTSTMVGRIADGEPARVERGDTELSAVATWPQGELSYAVCRGTSSAARDLLQQRAGASLPSLHGLLREPSRPTSLSALPPEGLNRCGHNPAGDVSSTWVQLQEVGLLDGFSSTEQGSINVVIASVTQERASIPVGDADQRYWESIFSTISIDAELSSGRAIHAAMGRAGPADFDPTVLIRALHRARRAGEDSAAIGGRYSLRFSPGTAGVLIHEILGHLVERGRDVDGIAAALRSRRLLPAGTCLIDDATAPGRLGSSPYSIVGSDTRQSTLIDDGYLTACLDDPEFGNAHLRSQSLAQRPTIRQSNLVLSGATKPGEDRPVAGVIEVQCLGPGRFDHQTGAFAVEVTEAELEGRSVRFAIVADEVGSFLQRVVSVQAASGRVESLFCAASGGALPVSVEHGDLLVEDVDVVPELDTLIRPGFSDRRD